LTTEEFNQYMKKGNDIIKKDLLNKNMKLHHTHV